MRRVPLVFVAGAVVAFALTGCFGGFPGGDEKGEEKVEKKLDQDDAPLKNYLEAIYGDPEEQAAEKLKSEEAVAVCMKEKGFEYIPYVDPSLYDSTKTFRSLSEEWVSENGYGVSIFIGAGSSNPNTEYRTSLPALDQVAYYEALWGHVAGDPSNIEDDLSNIDEVEFEGGCTGPVAELESFAGGLQDELLEFFSESTQEQKQIAAKFGDDWASCMEDAGYSGFTDPSEASQKFYADAIGVDPNFDWDSAEGTEMKKLEIETALADFRCGEEVGYHQELLEAQFKSQEQFIENHQEELDALRGESEQDKN